MSTLVSFAVFLGILSIFDSPPRSCADLVSRYHSVYNSGSSAELEKLFHPAARGRSGSLWESRGLDTLRRRAGPFIRIALTGFSISPRSLTTIEVRIWLISDFEHGRFQEGFTCITGLGQPAALLDIHIEDMSQQKAM